MDIQIGFFEAYGFFIGRILSDLVMNTVVPCLLLKILNEKVRFRRIIIGTLTLEVITVIGQLTLRISQVWWAIIVALVVFLICLYIFRFPRLRSAIYVFYYFLVSLFSTGAIIYLNVLEKADFMNAFSLSGYVVYFGAFNLFVLFNTAWLGLLYRWILKRSAFQEVISGIRSKKAEVYILANILFFSIVMMYFAQVLMNLWMTNPENEYSLFICVILLLLIMLCIVSSAMFLQAERRSAAVEYQKNINRVSEYALRDLGRQKEHFGTILRSLYTASEAGDPERLAGEMEELIALRGRFSTSGLQGLSNIKNPAVLGLLTAKLEVAHALNLNVDFRVNGVLDGTKHTGAFELGEILGILMDNAIEAALDSNGQVLDIAFDCEEDSLTVSVGNSFGHRPDIVRMFEKGWSTKGEGRGMGLHIAKDIVSKNRHLLLNTTVADDRLVQELVLS